MPDFWIHLLVSQGITAWVPCSAVEKALEYKLMVLKISDDELSLTGPTGMAVWLNLLTWASLWQDWCIGVALSARGRYQFLWENGELRLMRSLLLTFNLNHLGNHRLHIYFGLLLVYTKGTASKDPCPRIPTGLITQSCGFDVLVPNLSPVSEYLGAMVIKCHWNTWVISQCTGGLISFFPYLNKSILLRSNGSKRTLTVRYERTMIKAKMPFN